MHLAQNRTLPGDITPTRLSDKSILCYRRFRESTITSVPHYSLIIIELAQNSLRLVDSNTFF